VTIKKYKQYKKE